MNHQSANGQQGAGTEGWLSRERVVTLALVVASGVVFYVCYCLIIPYLPAIAWALALAVIAHPLHRHIKRWIRYSNIAAGVSVLIVALLIVAPVIFVSHTLLAQVENYTKTIQDELAAGEWRSTFDQNPMLRRIVPWLESQLGMESSDSAQSGDNEPTSGESNSADAQKESIAGTAAAQNTAKVLDERIGPVVTGTIWLVMQLFISFLSLFFFFRDRHSALAVLRSLLPLSNAETDEVFSRVNDTIHVTIYGSLVVASIQGAMGGLMFWWLELPAPLLWGAVMGLLAIVPILGTFVVWAPTAVYLAARGDWQSAIILAAWGGIAIALIDNFLYPFLVGKRLRFHTLLVFFAIVGGLSFFGASGIILGPLLLSLTDALLNVWRRRTAFGGTIEGGVESSTA